MRLPSLSCLLVLSLASFVVADESKGGPSAYKHFKFRNVGPAAGGRICRACGVPGDPNTYYAAASAGGLWKSEDGGFNWKAVTDDVELSSVGSLALAPSNPNVIYLGSGEANIRGNVEVGNGIWRSTDAGKTWQHVWKNEGQIGTMVVHPIKEDIAFAAVLGKAFGPSKHRGVYRTTDGGKNWVKVLFVDSPGADTGASDVCIDTKNPSTLFAGTWQTRRKPWELLSGGPGSGLHVSRDSGNTWTRLVAEPEKGSPEAKKPPPKGEKRCKGLPKGNWGRVGVSIAPSDSDWIYALIEAEEGGLFRSENGGDSWVRVNKNRALQQRAWYYSTLTVHPTNPKVVYFPQVPFLMTEDGGNNLKRVLGTHHGDHHDLWIDPKNPNRMIDSNDGGVDVSTNGGKSWYAPPLPISQFYHIAVDNHVPYRIAGTMQDIGSARGPSNSLASSGIRQSDWHPVGGGEAGHVACDPDDHNIVYAGEYMGYVSRYDHRTKQAKSIGIYPFNASGFGADKLKYRFQWTAPIVISPHDSKTIYHGGNFLFMTKNAGMTWAKVGKKDLTHNDPNKQKWSGGPITGDNTGVEVHGTIFALAESPATNKGLLWAGTDDGKLHVRMADGEEWKPLTPNLKGVLPPDTTICCIEPSRTDVKTAYVVADGHKFDDRTPYLLRTSNQGKTWVNLGKKVPSELGYLQVVRIDPTNEKILYVGGEYGLAFSRDAGESWERLKLNLPAVRVTDMHVKGDDLVVGTNGRSIWIFDDLTPLRTPTAFQLIRWTRSRWNGLLKPRDVHRYRYSSSVTEGPPGWNFPNPPAGAMLHYQLADTAKEVKIEIRDDKRQVIRTLTSKKLAQETPDPGAYSDPRKAPRPLPTEPGLHRVVWDLRHKGAFTISGARVDSGRPDVGPLANPGNYTVELTIDNEKTPYVTTVMVLPDPRTTAGLDPKGLAKQTKDLTDQLKFALEIRDAITLLAVTAEELRDVRRQIVERENRWKNDPNAQKLLQEAKDLVKEKLDPLEERLHNPRAEVAYDILAQKGGAQLYSQLAWQFELIKDADGAPTQGIDDVNKEEAGKLEKCVKDWKAIVEKDLPKLNDRVKELKLELKLPIISVPPVVVPATDARPTETRKARRWGR